MTPTALVVSTVHWPDDTRIRERLIRTLSSDFRITYAVRSPGPSDLAGLQYLELRGGRAWRNLRAMFEILRGRWDVLIVHDPELIPGAIVGRLLRRRSVVLDVHEDYPALAFSRDWVPERLRRTLAGLVAGALRIAERSLTITLAEPGYERLFDHDHPVFPNYPETSGYPPAYSPRTPEAVYLGDATRERGILVAVDACSRAGLPLRLIGRISPSLEGDLHAQSHVSVEGVLPNPEAIQLLSRASVGLVPLLDVPNYRFSQPTKLLEYLAAGLPVVASDLPGTRELVEDLRGVWLVPPGDPGAMAEAISQASSDRSIELAVAQAPEVRRRFKWPAEDVRGFYRGLVSR